MDTSGSTGSNTRRDPTGDAPPEERSTASASVLRAPPPGSTEQVRSWWRRLAGAVAVAVVVLFALQLVRVLIVDVGFALRADGADAGGLMWALALPSILGLAAPLWPRLLGDRWAVLATAGVTALLRLLELWSSSPGSDRWLATLGIAAGLWALAALLAASQDTFAHGVVLGIAADTAVRGAAGTVDLSWEVTSRATLLVVALALLLAAAAWFAATPARRSAPDASASVPLVALGPLLFLELLILQNQGWVATATGWSPQTAFLLLGAGNALGILGASIGRTMPGQNASGLIGGVLLLLVTVRAGLGGILAALLFLAAHLGAGMVIGAVTAPVPPERNAPGQVAHAVALSVAWAVFAALVLGFELPDVVSLGLPPELLVVGAGGIVVVLGLGASVSRRPATRPQWPAVVLGLALVAVPVQAARTATEPATFPAGEGLPRRVATYDTGFGIGPAGVPDLEGIASVLEATGATVIGLQDVPRGRLLSGSIDLVAWLQQRLDYPYAAFHAPSDNPLWGNAILSRLPLDRIRREELPVADVPVRRGVLAADVDAGGEEPLRFLVTKLTETDARERVHAAQMSRLLEIWDGAQRTVLVGNFEAPGGTPATNLVVNAGFRDGWAYAGSPPGYTAPARDPAERIDWLFHTEDLRVSDAQLVDIVVSDHLALAATVREAPPPEEPATEEGDDGA